MTDETRPGEPAEEQPEKTAEADGSANPPQQNADVDVKTDGGVDDPAAK